MWALLTGHFSKPYHMSFNGWSWCQEVIVKGKPGWEEAELKFAQCQVGHHINAVWHFIMIILFICSNSVVNSCDIKYLGEKSP